MTVLQLVSRQALGDGGRLESLLNLQVREPRLRVGKTPRLPEHSGDDRLLYTVLLVLCLAFAGVLVLLMATAVGDWRALGRLVWTGELRAP